MKYVHDEKKGKRTSIELISDEEPLQARNMSERYNKTQELLN